MSESPQSTSRVTSLPLLSGTDHQRAHLGEIEAELQRLVDSVLESRDPEILGSLHGVAWERMNVWGECRALGDVDVPFTDYGLWDLSAEESVFLNTGFVHEELAGFEGSSGTVVAELNEVHRHDSEHAIIPLERFLSDVYRQILGVDRGHMTQEHVDTLETELEEKQQAIARIRGEMVALIDGEDRQHVLRPLHRQLQKILEPLARILHVTQRGHISPEDRRKEMKMRELAQRVRLLIQDEIPTFGIRKQFEELERQVVHALMDVLDTESALAEARRGLDLHCDPRTLNDAMREAIRRCQSVMRQLLDAGDDEVAVLALDRKPRWSACDIAARWDEFLEGMPTFARQHEEGDRPTVVLLPGRGDAYFDVTSGCVMASLFPLESRIRAIDHALAQAYFSLNKSMMLSFSKATKIDPDNSDRLFKQFHKHYTEFRSRSTAGDVFMGNWMRNQMETHS